MNEELQGVKNELLEALQGGRAEQKECEARILCEMTQAVYQVVYQVVHDFETKMLTAFLRWQDNSKTKFQPLEADTGNTTREIGLRLENVEARLEEVEKRYLSGGGPVQ